MMFGLSNNKETVYLQTDILEQIQHEIECMILNQTKQFKLIMNSLNVVME